MSPVEALTAIAEFSIGLAGFTGIVAVFADKKESVRASIEFRVRNLLLISFTPGFISLFVLALLYSGMSDQAAIRVGSGALGLFIAGLITTAVLVYIKMPRAERHQLSRFLWWFTMVAGGINLLAQLVNLVTGPYFQAGILLIGLVATLLISAMTFFVLITQLLRGST